MFEAVLFDCDGVLFHSEQANIRFFNTVLDRIGRPPLDAQGEMMARSMAGPQLLRALFGDDTATIARARQSAQSLDYDPFYQWMVPVPELHAVLERLRRSFRLGMATNRGSTVPGVLDRFGLRPYFDVAVGTLDVAQPKPAPDMLLKCLDTLGVAARRALYVGDSESDYQAATAAGIAFVAVGCATSAAARIEQLRELPECIATLLT